MTSGVAKYAPRVKVHPDRYGVARTDPILWAVLHTSEGAELTGSAEALGTFLGTPGDRQSSGGGRYGASYHVIGDTDQVIPAVPYGTVAYSAGGGNAHGIHFVFPGKAGQTRDQWLDQNSSEMIWQCARWLIDVSRELLIPLVRIHPADLQAKRRGVCDHLAVSEAFNKSDHWDVGPHFPWDVLFGRVELLLEALTPTAPPPTEDDNHMRPIITTWTGEPQWPIIASWDPSSGCYTWRGIPGPEVDQLLAVGAAVDGRATPWPVAWKTQPWVKRLG
jgi:hypothetical protein